jgi:hypothetical protein
MSLPILREERANFEPYDRIQFPDGHVDPIEWEFKITITDPPDARILVQEPKLFPPACRRLPHLSNDPRTAIRLAVVSRRS